MATRTPEQTAADDKLTEAVNDVIEAYGYRESTMVNTQYMVLVEQHGWDDDGDQLTGVVKIYKDGNMGWVSIIGLLRAAALSAEHNYCHDGRSSD